MSDKKKEGQKLVFDSIQSAQDDQNMSIAKSYDNKNGAMMSMLQRATGSANKKRAVPRLAFAENPHDHGHYAGIYKSKRGLLPDTVIKQIRVRNTTTANRL